MKLSELKTIIDECLKLDGDLDVVICTEVDGAFCIENKMDADAIQLPDDDGVLGPPVFAILNIDIQDSETAETFFVDSTKSDFKRAHLKIVKEGNESDDNKT